MTGQNRAGVGYPESTEGPSRSEAVDEMKDAERAYEKAGKQSVENKTVESFLDRSGGVPIIQSIEKARAEARGESLVLATSGSTFKKSLKKKKPVYY